MSSLQKSIMEIADIRSLLLKQAVARSSNNSSDWDFSQVNKLKRRNERMVLAAVLLPIIDKEEGISIILTKRSNKLKHHPGQIAFPGGKMKGKEAPWLCALREAQEEIGLDPRLVRNIGEIPRHQTITGFDIIPFVGEVLERDIKFSPDMNEVTEVFEVPLDFILNRENMSLHTLDENENRLGYYAIPYGPYYIWGATARIIKSFSEAIIGKL